MKLVAKTRSGRKSLRGLGSERPRTKNRKRLPPMVEKSVPFQDLS